MRQRKLLLPSFHGEAIAQYTAMIAGAAEEEIDRWPLGEPFALTERMQAITLDVIMAGIFGIEGKPEPGTPEAALRRTVRRLARASTRPQAKVSEIVHLGRDEPIGPMKLAIRMLDRPTYAVIAARRRAADLEQRRDILSLLLQARTEEGEALDDKELRDELLTLVLAGHETTANSLSWAWERLTRNPAAHESLLHAVRADEEADEWVEATITEAMRSRPVIPMIGRRVAVPWQLGEYAVPAGTPVAMSILLVHHREDVYPDPFAFRPRALPRRPQARHLRVDPLRRRHPPLPRRRPGDGRDARRPEDDGAPPRPRSRPARARARPAPQRDDDPGARRPRRRARAALIAAQAGRPRPEAGADPRTTIRAVCLRRSCMIM